MKVNIFILVVLTAVFAAYLTTQGCMALHATPSRSKMSKTETEMAMRPSLALGYLNQLLRGNKLTYAR